MVQTHAVFVICATHIGSELTYTRRDLRRPKIDRLRELQQQKRDLEDKMTRCYSLIDQVMRTSCEQIEQAVNNLVEDAGGDSEEEMSDE